MSDLHAFLDGAPVGTFTMNNSGTVTFTYADDHRNQSAPTPISLSMRPTRRQWPSRTAMPFLAGLLPDSEDRLNHLAVEYRTTSNPFRLLEHVGRDAAGAIQLLPTGSESSDAAERSGKVRKLSTSDLDAMINDLVADPGTWGKGTYGGHWSLAGAQSKVALFRFSNGAWGIPQDSTPTTHILKPAVAALPNHDVNEFVTMEAARLLGLRVADHELMRTASGIHVFVSRRYDRVERDGVWQRLHQEDLCQAMAVAPERKYQELGGPSVRQIAGLLRDAISDISERRAAQQGFFDALVFNVAMMGTDAHAKNYSLMLDQERVTLAPLYDLASHAAYPTAGGKPLTSAMSMDDVYRLDAIGEPQFLSVARSLSIESDRAIDRVREITRGVSAAYSEAAARVDGPFAGQLSDAVAKNADRRGWNS